MSGEGSEEFAAVCCDMFVPQYIFSFSPLRVELRDGGGGYSLVKNDCRFFVVVIRHSGLFFLSNSDLPS